MHSNTSLAAARKGNLTILQLLRSWDCPWDERTCAEAAVGGHWEVLQWLRGQGCTWDSTTCSSAAESCQWDILKWARREGCPWDANTGIQKCPILGTFFAQVGTFQKEQVGALFFCPTWAKKIR